MPASATEICIRSHLRGDSQSWRRILELQACTSGKDSACGLRFYPIDAMKRNNFVSVRERSRWVSLLKPGMNFIVNYDAAHSQAHVTNHHRRLGSR